VDDNHDPRCRLARRLRALREEQWPGVKVTQTQLAAVLGRGKRLSVPLISSWESTANPKIPPIARLEAYASFFATRRSVDGEAPRLLQIDELTGAERDARDELVKELLRLRSEALRGLAPAAGHVADSPGGDYWRFADGMPITIVCAQLPADMLVGMPHSNPADPHYVALSAYADLDALFELHGHIRAANPASEVHVRSSQQLNYPQPVTVVGRVADDYTTHLVLLGGVDWNLATRSVLNRLHLPVRQVPDWDAPDGPYFEADQDDLVPRYHPRMEHLGDREMLLEDVALFARAINPFNRRRTVTVCNGIYGSGTFGAVRALTDAQFRDRNTEYARAHFGDSDTFCILTRVTVENGVPLTPDWTLPEDRLFEWSSVS
jgi:hypothetical protein